jgi:hypothetical protein
MLVNVLPCFTNEVPNSSVHGLSRKYNSSSAGREISRFIQPESSW